MLIRLYQNLFTFLWINISFFHFVPRITSYHPHYHANPQHSSTKRKFVKKYEIFYYAYVCIMIFLQSIIKVFVAVAFADSPGTSCGWWLFEVYALISLTSFNWIELNWILWKGIGIGNRNENVVLNGTPSLWCQHWCCSINTNIPHILYCTTAYM